MRGDQYMQPPPDADTVDEDHQGLRRDALVMQAARENAGNGSQEARLLPRQRRLDVPPMRIRFVNDIQDLPELFRLAGAGASQPIAELQEIVPGTQIDKLFQMAAKQQRQ